MNTTREAPSLVFVTQVIDPGDPVLGFTIGWARALSKRCSRLAVITNEARVPVEGLEVHSLGKELGHSRVRRTARYLALVDRLGRERRWTGLLAHMCPEYVLAVAPVARWRGIPLWLWYAHPSDNTQLRVAQRLATGVLTSLPGSNPRVSPKVHVIGQATDLGPLALEPPVEPRHPLRLVAIGRTSPSKGYPTIVEGVARARVRGVDLRLRLVAPATTDPERAYRDEIVRLIDDHGLADMTTFQDAVLPTEIPSVLQHSHALVNNTVSGSGDKVVFEAMASGRPVLVSNPSFGQLLAGLQPSPIFPPNDAEALSSRIEDLAAATTGQLVTVGAELRRRVADGHSLDHWADAVVATLAGDRS